MAATESSDQALGEGENAAGASTPAKKTAKKTVKKAAKKTAKKPKAGPKPETECFYCKGNGHWKRKCPEYLVDKKDGKVNKGIFDIQVIDVYLTSVYSSP